MIKKIQFKKNVAFDAWVSGYVDIIWMLIIGILIVVLGIAGIKILVKIGKIAIYIIVHMLLGLILLFLFNLLPFFKIPINILTVLVAGFGGIFGVLILIIAKFLGLY